MGILDVFKVVFIPALIALMIYAVGAYLLIPLIQYHQNRYSEYLPLGSISNRTTSLRDRVFSFVTSLVVPRRIAIDEAGSRRGSAGGEEFLFEDADGDNMVGFDVWTRDPRVRGGEIGRGIEGRRFADV